MTCKDCRNCGECREKSQEDELIAAKMHNVSFWDTAERTCCEFEEKEDSNETSTDKAN